MFLSPNFFYLFQWFWISPKKHNSHGHFKCINKHKFTPRSYCLSAIMLLSIYSMLTTTNRNHCTEVGRAFLIHFQKWLLNKLFIRIKIANYFKFYVWMIIFGNKSVKKGQKIPKRATNWTYNAFSKKKLSWQIWNVSIAKIWWKKNGVII